MSLLIQFLLRLSFGLAAGMAITSPKLVTSGYFRINLYVTLGLTSLAALLSRSAAPEAFWYAVSAAGFSYVGAVCWLYEKSDWGKRLLPIVFACSLTGAVHAPWSDGAFNASPEFWFQLTEAEAERLGYASVMLPITSIITSGLLLGMTMAAMLLGHWYLNTPTMELAPLKRLIIAMGCAVALQAVVSSFGLWLELGSASQVTTQWMLFVALRWLFGIVGIAALAWMAWETLKIPNTQSATGILYVAVIGTFVGETMALLLSRESLFPL